MVKMKPLVVVTCKDKYLAITVQNILKRYQNNGTLERDLKILCIEDPDTTLGSGSATLNALLYTAEYLSSHLGYNVITSDMFNETLIIVIHTGDNFYMDPLGKAFTVVPEDFMEDLSSKTYDIYYNIVHLINIILEKLSNGHTLSGVWICSTAMYLSIPYKIDIMESKDCTIITVPQSVEYAKSHGVYKLNSQNYVQEIVYRGTADQISECARDMYNFDGGSRGDLTAEPKSANKEIVKAKSDKQIPIVIGLVYLPVVVAQTLLYLNTKPPLDRSTYMGQDRGATSLKLTLFFDILYPMYGESSLATFLDPDYDNNLVGASIGTEQATSLLDARKLLWRHLERFKVRAICVPEGRCLHLPPLTVRHFMSPYLSDRESSSPSSAGVAHGGRHFGYHSYSPDLPTQGGPVLFNTFLSGAHSVRVGSGTVLKHCKIDAGKSTSQNTDVGIGDDCYLYGLELWGSAIPQGQKLIIPPQTAILSYHVRLTLSTTAEEKHGGTVMIPAVVVLGIDDDVKVDYMSGTYMNEPFVDFMADKKITEDDLWPRTDLKNGITPPKDLYSARMFPILIPENLSLIHIMPHKFFKVLSWCLGHDSEPCKENLSPFDTDDWRRSWRLSLKEIMDLVDYETEANRIKRLYQDISEMIIAEMLHGNLNLNIEPMYLTSCVDGFNDRTLAKLDEVSYQVCRSLSIVSRGFDCRQGDVTNPECDILNERMKTLGKLARILSNIADFMNCWAGPDGGLKSGPAANLAWRLAHQNFKNGLYVSGLDELKQERLKWLTRPDHLIRAARHYAAASQCIIAHQVATAQKNVLGNRYADSTPFGKFIVVRAPARLDLAGGWTDTPPISYENLFYPRDRSRGSDGPYSGIVVNLAVSIDGVKPIGAMGRKIVEPVVRVTVCDAMPDAIDYQSYGTLGDASKTMVWRSSEDFRDTQPQSPGAIFKVACLFSGIVETSSTRDLPTFLMDNHGGGFDIYSWSIVPEGSGLGTSTILVACILALLWTLIGKKFSQDELLHAILIVEQMLTTGGGWQDQVGGIYPGAKAAFSYDKFPLTIKVEPLILDESFADFINQRLLIVFTGKARLARNILQEVIRNWYARKEDTVKNVHDLCENALLCRDALLNGDAEKLGLAISTYRYQKCAMAPMSSEPESVKLLLSLLEPYSYGCALAGAGGGGFAYAILRDPSLKSDLERILRANDKLSSDFLKIYSANIDKTGLTISSLPEA